MRKRVTVIHPFETLLNSLETRIAVILSLMYKHGSQKNRRRWKGMIQYSGTKVPPSPHSRTEPPDTESPSRGLSGCSIKELASQMIMWLFGTARWLSQYTVNICEQASLLKSSHIHIILRFLSTFCYTNEGNPNWHHYVRNCVSNHVYGGLDQSFQHPLIEPRDRHTVFRPTIEP